MPFTQIPRNRRPHLIHQTSIKLVPSLHQQEQHHALVAVLRPPLSDAQRVLHAVRKVPLDHRVDLGGPKADSRGVQNAVGPAQKGNVACDWVHDAEVAVCPDVGETCEVGGVVAGAGGGGVGWGAVVTPEEAGDVGEGGRRDEFAWSAGWDFLSLGAVGLEGVVDCDVDPKGGALGAADVDRC